MSRMQRARWAAAPWSVAMAPPWEQAADPALLAAAVELSAAHRSPAAAAEAMPRLEQIADPLPPSRSWQTWLQRKQAIAQQRRPQLRSGRSATKTQRLRLLAEGQPYLSLQVATKWERRKQSPEASPSPALFSVP